MEIVIKQESKEEHLFRTTYKAAVSYAEAKTPSRKDLVAAFAKKVGKSADLVVIKRLAPHFGDASADMEIRVYDNAEMLKRMEPEHLLKRGQPKAAAPAAA